MNDSMLYGIQASGDTQLSSVMRAINDDTDMCHAAEKRLSRNVANEEIGGEIDRTILGAGAKFVKDDTLILVDPTEIRKEFGLKMEHITTVRDASRSSKEGRDVIVHGYHGCMAVAVSSSANSDEKRREKSTQIQPCPNHNKWLRKTCNYFSAFPCVLDCRNRFRS